MKNYFCLPTSYKVKEATVLVVHVFGLNENTCNKITYDTTLLVVFLYKGMTPSKPTYLGYDGTDFDSFSR